MGVLDANPERTSAMRPDFRPRPARRSPDIPSQDTASTGLLTSKIHLPIPPSNPTCSVTITLVFVLGRGRSAEPNSHPDSPTIKTYGRSAPRPIVPRGRSTRMIHAGDLTGSLTASSHHRLLLCADFTQPTLRPFAQLRGVRD